MKVLVEAAITPTIYNLGGDTAVLRIEALKGFTSSTGHLIPPSSGQNADFYLEVPITIDAGEMLITGFEIDSTQDAYPWDSEITGDVPGYRATIVTSKGKKIPFFPQFMVPVLAAGDPSMTWGEIRIFNRAFRRRFTELDRYINVNQAQEWIATAVGQLNKASDTNTGVVAISHPATDPTFPIAVSLTHPLIVALLAGTHLIVAAGQSEMVDGVAVIAEPLIRTTHIICPHSMSVDVNGNLQAAVAEIVEEVGFTIRSTEGGDNGTIGWFITAPS